MAVYVDPLTENGWHLGPNCHLCADSLPELHAFARRIGMRRTWFQPDNRRLPHYNLTAQRRAAALRLGAVEITRRQLVARFNPKLAEKMLEENHDSI
jgi:hypothetical protein